MKNFWKKQKVSISIFAFILLVTPLFYWTVGFAIRDIQKRADGVQEKIIDSDLERAKIGKIPKMEQASDEFEKNKDFLGTILSSGNKVDFIRDIENLADETGNKIKLKIINDDETIPEERFEAKTKAKKSSIEEKKTIEDQVVCKRYISMQIDLVGDYMSFLNFVHKLENDKYYVDITSFNLQRGFFDENGEEKNRISSSDGFFLSANSGGLEANESGKPRLKSSINIIVYIE